MAMGGPRSSIGPGVVPPAMGMSSQLRQPTLLTPRRRAGGKQRCAGLKNRKIKRGCYSLALIALAQHFLAMFRRQRLAHEIARALFEALFVCLPPCLNFLGV